MLKMNGQILAAHRYALTKIFLNSKRPLRIALTVFAHQPYPWLHSHLFLVTVITLQNDVHDSATVVVPPPAAESTESPTEHVGAISLDIDEDDPFHDHAVSSLAYGTTSDLAKSRQAQIERLEQKRLQEEEKQHTINNPFGQVIFSIICHVAPLARSQLTSTCRMSTPQKLPLDSKRLSIAIIQCTSQLAMAMMSGPNSGLEKHRRRKSLPFRQP